jgi:hypothetical protein
MPRRPSADQRIVHHHRDGTVRARGTMRDGELHGDWVWFRLDGTRLRSGSFDSGVQVGEWITYDRRGAVYKITRMEPAAPAQATRGRRTGAPRRASKPG